MGIQEGILLDNRPDLLDVVSSEITGKTVKQHVQNAVNNKIKDVGKKKNTAVVVNATSKNQKGPQLNKNYNKPNNNAGIIRAKTSNLSSPSSADSSAGAINLKGNSSTGNIKRVHPKIVGKVKKTMEAFESSLKEFDNILLEACSKVEELQGQKEKNEKEMKGNPLKAQELARKAISKGIEDKIKKLEENFNSLNEICTSVATMAPFPVGLAGKEQPSKNKKGKEKRAMLGYKYMKIRKAQ